MCEGTHITGSEMRQAKVLNAAELKRLHAVVESKRHAVRNATAVALSFYAGLRACEIAALRVGDVFDATGAVRDTIYLRAEQTKGSTGNTAYVNKRLAAALRRYAASFPRRIADPEQALIFSAKSGGFTAQTVVNLCIDPAESAQVKPLKRMPRRGFSCRAPDAGVGCCRS
jgi:integrase/recombinase XerD